MSKFLSLDAILAAPDSKEDTVEVPEWGGQVKVRALSKGEQLKVRKEAVKKGIVDERLLEGLILVTGMTDPKAEPHNINDLFEKNSGPVDRILRKIMDISGMGDAGDAAEAEGDMKSE